MKKLAKLFIPYFLVVIMFLGLIFTFAGCNKDDETCKLTVIDIPILNTDENYGFAIAKSNTELLGYANNLIDELKKSGELDNIINSFANNSNSFKYQNPTNLPNDAKTLKLVTNAYFEPFEYFVNDTTFSGIDIYLGYLLAQKLTQEKGENYYLIVESNKFETILESVATKESDIGIAAISITPSREKSVAFSKPYYTSYQVVITREDDTTFSSCKSTVDIDNTIKGLNKSFIFGSQEATTGESIILGDEESGFDGYPNVSSKGYISADEAFKALANGKVNAVILDVLTAKTLANAF